MRRGPGTLGFTGPAVGRGLALLSLAAAPPQAAISQTQQAQPHRQTWARSATVAAEAGWTAAGLAIEKGDRLVAGVRPAAAGALASRSAVTISPEGTDQKLPNLPAPTIAAGALIGRIGGGAPFKVGRFYRGFAANSGPLELRLNLDDRTVAAVRGRNWAFQVVVANSRDAPPSFQAPPPEQPPVQPSPPASADPGPAVSSAGSPREAAGQSVFDSIPEADLSDPSSGGRPIVPQPPKPLPKPPGPIDPEPAQASMWERTWLWLLLAAGLAAWGVAAGMAWTNGREGRLLRRTVRVLGVSASLGREDSAAEAEDFVVRGPAVSVRARLERGEGSGHG
jgi:hypothetical protein